MGRWGDGEMGREVGSDVPPPTPCSLQECKICTEPVASKLEGG
jgi:hypothetical protein